MKSPFLRVTLYCLLLAAFCLFSGCATTSDIDMLREDIGRLQRDSLSTRNELNALKESTAGAAKEESFNVIRQSQAEIQSTLSNVSRDLQVLSGRFDENKYSTETSLKNSAAEMELIKQQIRGMEGQIKEIKDRLNALEGQVVRSGESSKEPAERKPEDSQKEGQKEDHPAKPSPPADKAAKYEAAYDAFKNKKYKEAREKFEVFIKEFPKDELTGNSYFWIAETYYNEKDFEGAILGYETFLKKYPNSKKVPNALLKQGLSFNAIGDSKTGKVLFEQVIERFPNTPEAELAKKNLESLKKKPAKKKK